jgi:hypothetical protein
MSAVDALKAARATGVELALDGDDLALKAASAPPAAVLDALSRHKAEIVVLLRPADDGWSAEDGSIGADCLGGINGNYWRHEQFAGAGDVLGALAAGEEATVADAVELLPSSEKPPPGTRGQIKR